MDIFRFDLIETSDDGDQQLLKGRGLPGEELVKVGRVMPHGLASHAPAGAHGLGVAVNGRRDEVAVLGLEAADKRVRNLPAGGTALYDSSGNVISLIGASASIDTASRPFTIKTGLFTIEASEIVMKAGAMVVRVRSGRIDLGAMDAPNRVMTDAGPSSKVWAIV